MCKCRNIENVLRLNKSRINFFCGGLPKNCLIESTQKMLPHFYIYYEDFVFIDRTVHVVQCVVDAILSRASEAWHGLSPSVASPLACLSGKRAYIRQDQHRTEYDKVVILSRNNIYKNISVHQSCDL